MSFLGNLLWILFAGGIITCIQYALAGLILCLTIIGIPFGLQCFKLAELALFPFGREIRETGSGMPSAVANLLWFLFAGLWIALTHLFFAVGAAITVIGIPFAIQHLKLARLALLPFGKELR